MDVEKVASGDRGATLTYPYLGWGTLTQCKFETRTYNKDKDNERSETNIEFYYMLDGDKEREGGLTDKGTLYIHKEKIVKDPSKTDKIQNQVNRIGYILKYLIGEANAKTALSKVQGADTIQEWWSNLGDIVSKVVTAALSKGKSPKVRLKCVGTVFNGDNGVVGYVAFTKYLGFLGNADKALAFSSNEIKDNAKYMRYLQGANSAGDASAGFNANIPGAGGSVTIPMDGAIDGLEI